MPNIITPEEPRKEGFKPCPDPWAKLHRFYNPATGLIIPARCKKYSCPECAIVNYYKIDRLLTAGNPERFITLTRAGRTPKEIRDNLQKLIQGLRRLGLKFEYAAIVELHLNGQAHLHILQRGDFIEQQLLSEMWEKYTAKSYAGQGSFIVDIRRIDPNQSVTGYLLKYFRKSWDEQKENPKSWAALQEKYPGLNHYRMSRNWLSKAPKSDAIWQLIPTAIEDVVSTPVNPLDELFYTENEQPLTPVQALALNGEEISKARRKKARAALIKERSIAAAHDQEPAGLLTGAETISEYHPLEFTPDLLNRLASYNEVARTGRLGPAY